MSQENVDLARRWIEMDYPTYAETWADTLRPILASDIACFPGSDQPEAKGFRGREAFIRYVESWLDAWDEYRIDASEYIDLGDYVLVVGRIKAHGKGSGVEVLDDGVWLMRFRNGEAIEYRECDTKADALEFAAAGLRE